jgi:hypothetical protein
LILAATASCGRVVASRADSIDQPLACDQAKVDSARELKREASAALTRKAYADANLLGVRGLGVIGQDYDPLGESLDDTGTHLSAAQYAETEGHLEGSAAIRLRVLTERIHAYGQTHRCQSAPASLAG